MNSQNLKSHETQFTVPFYDLDPMRIVWHGNYLKYFDTTRALAEPANVRLLHLESLITFYEKLIAPKDGELNHSAIHKLLWT